MESKLSFSVALHEEESDGKKVFAADCIELGVSDFGDDFNDAVNNLKKGVALILEESPEKKKLF